MMNPLLFPESQRVFNLRDAVLIWIKVGRNAAAERERFLGIRAATYEAAQ